MSLLIRNIAGNVVEINDLGISLDVAEEYDLTQESASDVAASIDLVTAINALNVIALDPLDNISLLTVAQSIEAVLAFNDTHFRIRGGDLNQLDDINLAGIADGFVLTYDQGTLKWIPAPTAAGTTADIHDTIWAEENGPLANASREWSFGNGSTGTNNVYAMYTGEITKMFIHAETPGTTVTIDVMINDVIADTGSFAANGVFTFTTPISVTEGDAIGFRTNTVVGTWTDVRTGVLFNSVIQGLVGPAGPAGADGAGVPVGGLAGQHLSKIDGTDFNTQWVTPVDNDTTDHTLLSNIGTNTHAQIDTHIADATIHYPQSSISITESQISDLQSYSLSTHTHALTDLSDVNIVTPLNNQVLTYNAGVWSAATPTGGGTPGGVDSNIQYNNGGVFGGNAAFSFDDVALQVDILGTGGDTQLTVGGTAKPDAAATAATLYVEVQATGQDIDGIYTYFNRTTAGISGWIANAYDGATPYIRIVDEDDDSPYVNFATVGTGTDVAPQFSNSFGSRNDPPGGTAGVTTGFQWLANGVDAMLLDTNFLTLPRDTTANRPAVPVNGMVRYNTTTGKFEGYESGAWVDLVQDAKSHLSRHNGAVTQTFTALTTILFGTNIRIDTDYTYAAGQVTITRAGWYKLEYVLAIDNGNNSRTSSFARMELNGAIINGTISNGYHRNAANGESTLVGITKQLLAINDVIRVRASGTSAIASVANGCSINIESID